MTDQHHDDVPAQPQADATPEEQATSPSEERGKPRKRRNRNRKRPMADRGSVTGTSTRHQARTLALQSLYEYDLTDHEGDDLRERLNADEDVPPSVREYASTIFGGVLENMEPIDAHIGEAAPAFPVSQLAAVDRNVLRIAIYELMHQRKTVPVRVAINEAIEIAKHYGSERSGKFVHGVLGTVSRKLPDSEANS
ncbi:MAG: transcription antitermination factor NusB [Chloroflexota bacterium]|nr:transcription antitermination factor NusB [Chloroflexota bacterium]